jgi:HK97 family phage portal protein
MFSALRSIFAKRQIAENQDPDQRRIAYHLRTLSGTVITPDTAPTVAAVWACLRYISQSVAMLPWRVMREGANGGELAPRHPVDYLLYGRPNPQWSSFQLRETLTHHALRQGNGYAEIERDALGRPIAIWPLHYDRVQPRFDDQGQLFYRVFHSGSRGGGFVDLDMMDVFHIRGFGEGPVGVNVMSYAAESIGWAKAAQLFGAAFFGNGMNVSGIVEAPKAMDEPARKRLRAALDNLYRGVRNAGRYAILDAGQKYTPVQIDPEKAQFIATNEYLVTEVARWFGVPPYKIADLTRATFSNVEQQSIAAVIDCILPWTRRFEDEADFKCFGVQNRQGFYTRINLNALLRGDTAARASYYNTLSNRGVLSVNDIRRAEDMNTIGPAGDIHVMQGQYQTLEQIAQGATAPSVPGVAAEPAPDQPGDPGQQGQPAVDRGRRELLALERAMARREGFKLLEHV